MIYSLNGERCTSSSRLLVQQGIADKFIEKLTARVKALKVGHPLDPATEIGPLIHERHLAKVCSYFDVAKKDGATIAVGGKPHDGPGGGHYVQPTLVTAAHSKMRVAQEEVFGPFLTVIPFKDEKEAIEIANGVQYGLTGYVWTGDMFAVQELSTAVQFKIGVVTLVFNNNAYGNVRRDQRERFDGRVVASDLVNPDFVKLAESFGVGAARVTSPDHFRPALEKALADGGPYVISVEVPTDSEVSPWAFIHPAKP